MAEENMKKLKRPELLRMLLDAVRENERLEVELASAQSLLESRDITIDESGSLAEAAMKLNGVFESAQAAADHYLVNVRQQYEGREEMVKQIHAEATEKAEGIVAEAQEHAQQLAQEAADQAAGVKEAAQKALDEAREESARLKEEAQAEISRLQQEAQEAVENLQREAQERVEALDSEAKARVAQFEEEARGRTEQAEQESQARIAQVEEESRARIAQVEEESKERIARVEAEANQAAATLKEDADVYASKLRAESDALKAEAEQVLGTARSQAEDLEAAAKVKAEALEAEARERIDTRMAEAERVCQNLMQATKAKCDTTMRQAMDEARQYNETMRMAMQTLGIDSVATTQPTTGAAASDQAGEAPAESDAEADQEGVDGSPFDGGREPAADEDEGNAVNEGFDSRAAYVAQHASNRVSTINGIEEAVSSARAAVAAAISAAKTIPGTLDEDSAAIFYPNATADASAAKGAVEDADGKEVETEAATRDDYGRGKPRRTHELFFIPRGPASADWDSVMSEVDPIDPRTAVVPEAGEETGAEQVEENE